MLPLYWKKFIEKHELIGSCIEIPDDDDLSGIGVEMEIMNESVAQEETENTYPGLVVVKDGYIPIGSCLLGSGDPYFINKNDGENGPVYRIYHDSVLDEGYDKNEAVEKVIDNYTKIIKYVQV